MHPRALYAARDTGPGLTQEIARAVHVALPRGVHPARLDHPPLIDQMARVCRVQAVVRSYVQALA